MRWTFGFVDLDHGRGQGGAPLAQELPDDIVLLVGEQPRGRGFGSSFLSAHPEVV